MFAPPPYHKSRLERHTIKYANEAPRTCRIQALKKSSNLSVNVVVDELAHSPPVARAEAYTSSLG